MSEDKTVKPETEKQVEKETPKNESTQTVKDDKVVDDVKQEDVDYKAELEAAQAQLEKKSEIIDKKNRAINALKREQKESENDLDTYEEVDEIKAKLEELEKRQEKELSEFKVSQLSDTIDDEIGRLAKSEDEKKLIKFHLENSVKFGSSKSDIRVAVKRAWIMANEKKLISTNKELAEALASQATTSTSANVSGEKIQSPEDKKLNAEEKAFLERYGVK